MTQSERSPAPAGLWDKLTLGPKDFARLAGYIYETCGIKTPPVKKTMLETRLQRRVRELGLASFSQYCDLLLSGDTAEQEELVRMIDLVTTNKTDFFREPNHFEYLTRMALPDLSQRNNAGSLRQLRVWSAGCSSGEEPYTLAMVLSEHASAVPGFRYRILATDLSTRVLQAALLGIYEEEKAGPIPLPLKRKYLLRSKDRGKAQVRIVPELRGAVTFRRLNFMDSDYALTEPLDVVFCRNVIIYFDRPTQEKVLNRIAHNMARGAYIFMGHSETLFGLSVPFEAVAPTVYRKP